MKEQKDLSNIALSFMRGRFMGESRKQVIIPYILLVVFCVLMLILDIVMSSIDYVNSEDKSLVSFLSGIFAFSFGILFFLGALLIIVHRNDKIRNDTLIWVEDAVELNAYCKNIGIKNSMFNTLIKLQVEFDFDENHYVRTTENEHRTLFDLGRPIGYFSGVSKFADKEIKILYSPKYDQVMILKDKKIRRK